MVYCIFSFAKRDGSHHCARCAQFIEFARELCEKIRALGYWADYIDPCSGLPMMTLGCNKVCKMICHETVGDILSTR